MVEHDYLLAAPVSSAAVESCWMCGTRLPADQLVADGGSACSDIRWYCRDTRTCTERWTSRTGRSASLRYGSAVPQPAPARQRAS
jgi:hypothetical protein